MLTLKLRLQTRKRRPRRLMHLLRRHLLKRRSLLRRLKRVKGLSFQISNNLGSMIDW
jgi:hypothetical protein